MLAPESAAMGMDSLLDRRRHARRRGGNVKIRVTNYKGDARPVEGSVLDCSPGGLCLTLPQFVAAGTVVSVRPANAPEEVPWVHVEVIYSNPRGDEWIVGCQFTHLVPWSVRVLFG